MGGGSVPETSPGTFRDSEKYARGDANRGRSCSSILAVAPPRRPTAANSESTRPRNPSSTTCGDSSRTVASGTPRQIAEGVRRAGGCDAFVCSGPQCDSAVAAAVARLAGASRCVMFRSGENRSSRRRDSRVHRTMDPTIVEAQDVATGAPGSGTRSLRLEPCADAGWDEDAGLDAARAATRALAPDESRTVL